MRISSLIVVAAGFGRAAAAIPNGGGVRLVSSAGDEKQGHLQGSRLERGLLEDIGNAISDVASTVVDVVKGAGDAVMDFSTCSSCTAGIYWLQNLGKVNEGAFTATLQQVCKVAGVQDPDVCDGAIALQAPILRKAIVDMTVPSKTATLLCNYFVGVCSFPDVEPWDIPFPNEKPEGLSRPEPSGQEPIKVVHYSDVHIDHKYEAGANANCTKPICCRPYTKEDEAGNTDSPAGAMGDHHCDVPVDLEESMYAAIKEHVPDAAFAIFTGDIVDHSIWETTKDYNTFSINDTYSRMANSLPLVYGTAGNHEAHPTNAFAAASVCQDAAQWVYDVLSASWTRWIGTEATEQTRFQGTYSVKYPGGNLRVISLNTNMYYAQNYWLYRPTMERDPNGQLEWLVSELDAAERARERVYLVGHMPGGDRNAFHDQSSYLDRIVNRYADTIAAMFYGHTHKDEFQISYADYEDRSADTASAIAYVAPSLTPTSGMPAFRVYTVDPVTFAVLDLETYMADMDDPGYHTKPVWRRYYSAKEAYGPLVDNTSFSEKHADLTPSFWHRLTQVFESNRTTFDEYLDRKSRGWNVETCKDDACRDAEICHLRGGRAMDNCHEPVLGMNFRKRDKNPFGIGHAFGKDEEEEECGSSVLSSTLAALMQRPDALEMLASIADKVVVKEEGQQQVL